jgi:hypothetical protein
MGSDQPEAPIALPVRWDVKNPRRIRLWRRFGRPPIDATGECLFLELDGARGVQSLLLNGKTLAAISPEKSYYLIPLTEIEDRNVLVLEVETGEAASDLAGSEPDWGQFALVIRSIEPMADGGKL